MEGAGAALTWLPDEVLFVKALPHTATGTSLNMTTGRFS